MEQLFWKLVHMSITAGWLVLAILPLRLIFRKAPKALWCLLWGMVALRLICPWSLESRFSVIPEPILDTEITAPVTGMERLEAMEQGNVEIPAEVPSREPPVLPWIWAAGMIFMAGYAAFSYGKLRRRLRESVPAGKGIRCCDHIDTPFILGLIRPVIYLPSDLDPGDIPYVLAHERAHLIRRDHWWKPLGFLLLTVYWFNPVLWLAYILLCRDIEMACDEKVMKTLGVGSKKPYSAALIRCSVSRHTIAACPLAFGEGSVKERVKTVLSYKKPTFWVILTAVLVCLVLAVCFLSDPREPEEVPEVYHFDQEIPRDSRSIVLKNLHNGITTEIADPAAVRSILDFMNRFTGRYPESGRGYSEGTYELTFLEGGEPMTLAIGDSNFFYTGDFGDGYPVRYHLYGTTARELALFLSHYDSSVETVEDNYLQAARDLGLVLNLEVLSPHNVLVTIPEGLAYDFHVGALTLERWENGEWTLFTDESLSSPEQVAGAAEAWTYGWMEDLPIGKARATLQVSAETPEGPVTDLLSQHEFEIIGETRVFGAEPLEYLPENYSASEAARDRCVVVGGNTVLANEESWNFFLAHAQGGEGPDAIRIALCDTGHEDSTVSRLMDVSATGSGYQLRELVDGKAVVTDYSHLHRVDFETTDGGRGYGYILSNDPTPPKSLEGNVIFRNMLSPEEN